LARCVYGYADESECDYDQQHCDDDLHWLQPPRGLNVAVNAAMEHKDANS